MLLVWMCVHNSYIVFLIYMSIIWICVMSCIRSAGHAGWPAILQGKNFIIGHYTQTVQPNCFKPAMSTGTIDFYHFTPLSLILNLPGGYQVITKQNLLSSFSHAFHQNWMKYDVVMNQFKLKILRLLLSKICQNKGNNCCFMECVKKQTFMNQFDLIWL